MRRCWFALVVAPLLLPSQAHAAAGLQGGIESFSVPYQSENRFTLLYGGAGYYELDANWAVRLGVYGTAPGLAHGSLSLQYLISGGYDFPLRPSVEIGLDPIWAGRNGVSAFALAAHAGFGLQYVFNNQWNILAGIFLYGTPELVGANGLATFAPFPLGSGSMGLQLGAGYLF